jgi:hypothetical protein
MIGQTSERTAGAAGGGLPGGRSVVGLGRGRAGAARSGANPRWARMAGTTLGSWTVAMTRRRPPGDSRQKAGRRDHARPCRPPDDRGGHSTAPLCHSIRTQQGTRPDGSRPPGWEFGTPKEGGGGPPNGDRARPGG